MTIWVDTSTWDSTYTYCTFMYVADSYSAPTVSGYTWVKTIIYGYDTFQMRNISFDYYSVYETTVNVYTMEEEPLVPENMYVYIYYARTSGTLIYFNQDGGSGGTSNVTAKYNTAMPKVTPPTKTGYTFQGYYTSTNGSGTKYYNADGTSARTWGTDYTLVGNTSYTLYAYWKVNSYQLDVNGNLDGKYVSSSGGAVDLDGYATFDMYINGTKVATGVTDYYTQHPYGTTYEIKNIQCAYDKKYMGVYSDNACTTISSLSGTLTSIRDVCLKIQTMTWEDYASSSYASGSGTEASPYIIKTPEQLGKLCVDSRSSTLSGKYYKLGASIDLSAHIWSGIGDLTNSFGGILNGNMYTINNLFTSKDYYINQYSGFVNYLSNGAIDGIIIEGGEIVGNASAGGIVGMSYGNITKCMVKGLKITANTKNAGGIYGNGGREVSYCVVINVSVTGKEGSGGIAGWTEGNIVDCSTINTNVTSETYAGVVVGDRYYTDRPLTGYGQGTVNGTATKIMYGDSSAWGNWTYSPNLNAGYPVQKTLFHIGGISGSSAVYNYLRNNLGFVAG